MRHNRKVTDNCYGTPSGRHQKCLRSMIEKAEGWHNGWELGPGKLDYYIKQREAAYGEQLSTYICGP